VRQPGKAEALAQLPGLLGAAADENDTVVRVSARNEN
jgi:hypothetical protein